MKIGDVGAGRLGRALGKRGAGAGHEVCISCFGETLGYRIVPPGKA